MWLKNVFLATIMVSVVIRLFPPALSVNALEGHPFQELPRL